jgi:uncharacterized protein YneF (UPF0154 family)
VRRKGFIQIIILGAIVAIVALVIIGFFLINKKGQSELPKTNSKVIENSVQTKVTQPPVQVAPSASPTSIPTTIDYKSITDFPIPKANWSNPEKAKFQVFLQCETNKDTTLNYGEIDGYSISVVFDKDTSEIWGKEISMPSDDQLSKLGWFEEVNDASGGVEGSTTGFAKRGDCTVDKTGKHVILKEIDLNARERIEKQIFMKPKIKITFYFN